MATPVIEVVQNSFALGVPTFVNASVLGIATAETVTVATDCNIIVFSANADFYVRWDGGTAAVPSGDVTDGTASELNPTVRRMTKGGSFSIISPAATIVTYALYRQ